MRPRAIESRIASAVGGSAQAPTGTTSARLACGWSWRTRSSRSPPVASESDLPASTSATSSPASASSVSVRSACSGSLEALDAVVTAVALDELSLDVFEDVLVFVDGEEDGRRHLVSVGPSGVASRIKAGGRVLTSAARVCAYSLSPAASRASALSANP